MSLRRALAAFLLGLPLFLAGCSLFPTTRTLPVPKAPSIVYTVTPARLVEQLNQRWDALETLTVKVTIQATTQKPREGLETTMPTVNAQILLRKPEMLRVYGRAPVINIPLFDMASDGENFTVFIPSKKEALKGANSLKKKSPNALENLRPDFFFYAMVVRGIKPDDRYTVTQETDTVEDPQRKHLYSVPQYILRISRPKSGSQQDTPVRFI
jgi:hypothetical protein